MLCEKEEKMKKNRNREFKLKLKKIRKKSKKWSESIFLLKNLFLNIEKNKWHTKILKEE